MFTGVVHLSQVRAVGVDPRAAVRHGTLQRLRPGWFAAPDARPDQVLAVLSAGFVSCISYFSSRGAHRPETDALHVGVVGSSRARRSRPDVLLHWGTRTPMKRGPAVEASPERALEHLLLGQPSDQAVAVIDSALHLGLIAPGPVASTLHLLPSRLRSLLAALDGRAESGIEWLTRFRLRACGIFCATQVEIPGVGLMDLLVDGWLIIELDGRRWHTTQDVFMRDRRRDGAATAQGYTVLRFTYADVVHHWDRTLSTIRATLARGRSR